MNNRFWGVWKAGEANTLTLNGLESASRVTLTSSCLFQGLAVLAPLCMHPRPLCVPQAHKADNPWPLAERVALHAKVRCQNQPLCLPGASWLSCSPACTTAVLPFHAGRVLIAAQARLELLDMPFILLQPAGLIGQIYVCVCACFQLPFLFPRSYCNGCGV